MKKCIDVTEIYVVKLYRSLQFEYRTIHLNCNGSHSGNYFIFNSQCAMVSSSVRVYHTLFLGEANKSTQTFLLRSGHVCSGMAYNGLVVVRFAWNMPVTGS